MADSYCRHLVLVLGDQLDRDAAVFEGLDDTADRVWMAEVEQEATHVPCSKVRLAVFFSAMRHFRDELRKRGWAVAYHQLEVDRRRDGGDTLAAVLTRDLERMKPEAVRLTLPGDWRVLEAIRKTVRDTGATLEVVDDAHFIDAPARFDDWAAGRKTLLLEDYYRMMRKRTGVLVDEDGGPAGGEWNFDKSNRQAFGRTGPGEIPARPSYTIDDVTREVIELVNARFADHPGRLDAFNHPVTRRQALHALSEFIENRLARFGPYQDAMWTGESKLYHSCLSVALNLKLISPRECIDRAVDAYENGRAPLQSVEGFVRQLLGWREFVRGVYWRFMPEYARRNALACDVDADVPGCYWNGRTEMGCVREVMEGLLETGYAHHIHRLMVVGLLAQLLGVHPLRFHEWHMAMYADAVDWVSLPNTLGMSQFGDGGVVGTKPYCASGAYINRMSNYCSQCRYDPKAATGDKACPFTTLYWDFLVRHRELLEGNRRMAFQMKNLERKGRSELEAIARQAAELREQLLGRPRS